MKWILGLISLYLLIGCNSQTKQNEKDEIIAQQQQKLNELQTRLQQIETPAKEEPEKVDTVRPPYFSKGDYSGKVLAVQGRPDSYSGREWQYGSSTVTFGSDDRVKAYQNAGNLKVKAAKVYASEPEAGPTVVVNTITSTKNDKPRKKEITYVYFVGSYEALPDIGDYSSLSKTVKVYTRIMQVDDLAKLKGLERCLDESVRESIGQNVTLTAKTYSDYDLAYGIWRTLEGRKISESCEWLLMNASIPHQ